MAAKSLDKIIASVKVTGKSKFKLAKYAAKSDAGVKNKKEAREKLLETGQELDELQLKLYAEAKKSLLVVFQAMDTGGKDGVIRKVFGPLNPQGVNVISFKRPSALELSRDYLWRVHSQAPARGMIHIFNRSHYEDVLVHRVHKLASMKTIDQRYRQLNDFERYLAENDIVILKFFLHISKDEQKRRLEARLQNPDKRWKFELGDLAERKFWDKYQDAYEAAIDNCSAPYAPWFVIPADDKWYRDWLVAEIIKQTLKELKPAFPKEEKGLDEVVVE